MLDEENNSLPDVAFTTIIVQARLSKFNVSFTDQYFADSQSKTENEIYLKFLF